MATQLDEFTIDVPNSKSTLGVKLFTSAQAQQKQLMLQPQEPRLQLDAPMLFWADCTLNGHAQEIVAVGWAQTMTSTVVEFCYTTATHGCVADLDLLPSPCADGGQGIWYGGVNTAALQFLGSAYANHDTDEVYFNLVNYQVCTDGGTAFEQQPNKKRVILSDSPFIAIPEQAYCSRNDPKLPVLQQGSMFAMGHGSPTRTADNSALLAHSQLECVKARYQFTTYFCALRAEDAAGVPNLTEAFAFAEIAWIADYCANITGTATRKNWQATGPLRIHHTGARTTRYTKKNGQTIKRCPGASCNLGRREVGFDYRQLQHFY